jgi:hypothetical protein
MSTVQNPIIPLTYSTYVPQQVDIENNVYNHILETELKLYDVRLKTMEERIEKIKEEFNTTIKIRFCDGIIGTVLLVVIYVKVYSQ